MRRSFNCPACGRSNRAAARFCDACGIRLEPAAGYTGERRQITALFCDIVEYSKLSEAVDEEDLHAIVRAYQRSVSLVIARWGGYVESFGGDGVNAYFGYPQAHENDAERAVRAGLEIIPTVRVLDLGGFSSLKRGLSPLDVRIGVHSGSVVVGELGTGEHGRRQALGPTMNIAARLEAIAPPGALIMSEATRALVAGMFRSDDLGQLTLKGIQEAVRAHAVIESTGVRGLDAVTSPTTPLIGRDQESNALQRYWDQARKGSGQTILVCGEPGIGKSKLVRSFTNSVLEAGDGRTFEWRCSPFYENTPFHPIIESLEHYLGLERSSARDEVDARVREVLSSSGIRFDGDLDSSSAAHLIVELMSPRTADADAQPLETPAMRRSTVLNVLCELARVQARSYPTVMVVEDVHWADPSSIELLNRLVSLCEDVPLLLLVTYRSEFIPPWEETGHTHLLSLERLTRTQSAELFDTLVGHRQVSSAVRSALLSRSDGIPLFVEELTRTVLDADVEGTRMLSSIPNTLRGLLVSRLDRLSAGALETIRMASALSREFRFDVLAGVSERPFKALREDLHELIQSDLVYRSRGRTSETYVFKHALVADAAYEPILRKDRRRLHRQIARRLGTVLPAIASEQPELLAHHFSEAGEFETAMDFWRQAGENAIARGAYKEAVHHFDRGLDLLPQLANDSVRLHQEIELTESKGRALFSMLGYAHPDVESTFAHASSLCERDGSSPPARVLYGLWAVHITRSNRQAVEALLPRFEELAKSGDPVALQTGLAHVAVHAFFTGDFNQCLAKMTEATRWRSTSWSGAGLYPFAYRMWSLSIMGRPDQATAAGEELQSLAEQFGDPYGLAIAGSFRHNLARDRRDVTEALQLAERQIAYVQRQMLPFWEGPARCARGWALASDGHVIDGIAEIRLGLQYLDAVGLRVTYPYHLGGLAEALLAAGDAESARAEARRGLELCATAFDRFYEAELLRFEAEANCQLGAIEAAESGFKRALDLARRQSAALFALRAATSLARLTTELGRGDGDRATLESILAELSEGRDLTDVLTARRVLAATV